MAQKAAKARAARNAALLRRTHLLALAINGFFLLMRVVLFRQSFTRGSLLKYILLSAPALAVEATFEVNSRPHYNAQTGELQRGGDDLESPGLTEFMWDVLYWTWGCIVMAALPFLGDKAWWAWFAVPLYSGWLAFTTFSGLWSGMKGAQSTADSSSGEAAGASKRSKKMEKRGAQQRVAYR